ncbi:sugar phosphate isomerase/epimerase [Paenibacillus motobuensis]|uniref:sugar phosphate isomerase/epimerase family protein n=1 Tax=Paenibacillus TaxID=44249 RepID=UPI00203A5D8D|nr:MULTISPECIES: sugar phosphate isomerase/epimerase family protein [Paenibacillus]MCM3042089.1 sugar phosphate isomerase/epimerase [Paenibacillus lutimineralis]MCM3649193.1 sugar phosphate isomerase/epimerase [Paenibacillus motobuensis]
MITIYDWFGYEMPIKERYQLIKEAGFDGVLLWWSDGFGRDCFGRNDYRRGPQIAREAGLFIENIHTPVHYENNLWLDNLDGEAVTDCYLNCVADCAAFEIPTMVVHLPNEDHPINALGLDRIKRITEKAEQLGVNVAMENLWNLTNLAYVLEQVASKRIGFCYDCGHHYNHYPDNDLLSIYGSRLMALHLHDNNGCYAQHGLPFDGTIDWSTTMKKIAETDYSGATSIEAMNWDYEDLTAKEFLHKAFERAKRLEALKLYNP